MKIKNDIQKGDAIYPTLKQYRNSKILNLTAAVGMGVSACSFTLSLNAEEIKVNESKEVKNNENNKLEKQIILLASNLGHDDYKIREKATMSLIAIGGKLNKAKNAELTAFLKTELEKCKKSKDPETKERAKKILLAITPPPPRPPTHHVKGIIAPVGF